MAEGNIAQLIDDATVAAEQLATQADAAELRGTHTREYLSAAIEAEAQSDTVKESLETFRGRLSDTEQWLTTQAQQTRDRLAQLASQVSETQAAVTETKQAIISNLDDIDAKMQAGLEGVAAAIGQVEQRFHEVQNAATKLTETVGTRIEEAIEATESLKSDMEEAANKLSSSIEALSGTFNQLEEECASRTEEAAAAVETFTEAASNQMKEMVEALESKSGETWETATDLAAESVEEAFDKAEELMSESFDSMKTVADEAGKLFDGKLQDGLGKIEEVNALIEDVKPVLELAAKLT